MVHQSDRTSHYSSHVDWRIVHVAALDFFLGLILAAVELTRIQNKHFDACFYREQCELSLRITFFSITVEHVLF